MAVAGLASQWHTCLVGCLHCRGACPLNKNVLKLVEQGPNFAPRETKALLEGSSVKTIPPETITELEQLDLIEYAEVLGRNFRALIMARQIPSFFNSA